MRQALDASLRFTDALGQVQTTILDRLDEIAQRLTDERRKIGEREEELVALVRGKAEFARMAVGQIVTDVSALRAIVADGSDDMVEAMARLLGPRVAPAPPSLVAEPDPETTALAQKLAPRPVVAEAAE